MAKKLSKSKKSPSRRPGKKSWVEKYLTFTNIVIVSVVLLSVFTIYLVTKSSNDVAGVSTSSVVSR